MTLLSSGALAIQDAGTNPSSNVLLDTGYNSLSLTSDSSFHMDRAWRFYDYELNQFEYSSDRVITGTAYVYKRGSTSAYKDTNMQTPYQQVASGFDSAIGQNLHTYMSSTPGSGLSWYGTNLGMDASNSSSLGSLGSGTFTSPNGDSRQINDVGIVQNTNSDSGVGAAQDKGNIFWFSLDGTVPNNSSDAFHQIVIYNNSGQGITLTRSAADYALTASSGGSSVWTWDDISDAVITYGNHHLGTGTRLYITASSSITYNNGIAEEFGGNDSSNVHLSHYYKGSNGAFDHATAGIPESGTLKISDFYGKKFVASNIHSSTLTSYYNTGGGYFVASGYGPVTSGSSVGDNTFTLSNGTSVTWNGLYNVNGTSMTLQLTGSSSPSNAGFTAIDIYAFQSNDSGSPDLTLLRTDASSSSASTTRNWTWSDSFAIGTFFGTSNGTTHYVVFR